MSDFTPGELKAIRVMAAHLATLEREDIVGVILKSGAFHHLAPDVGVVKLADKLTPTHEELFPWRYKPEWLPRWQGLMYREYKRLGSLSFEEWLEKYAPDLDPTKDMPEGLR